MFIRFLAISALAVVAATGAAAQGSHNQDMFKGPRLHQAFGGGDHSKDAILPDGTINVDPTVTGSVNDTNVFSQPRLQCDSSPNTVGNRSNTYNLGTISGCP